MLPMMSACRRTPSPPDPPLTWCRPAHGATCRWEAEATPSCHSCHSSGGAGYQHQWQVDTHSLYRQVYPPHHLSSQRLLEGCKHKRPSQLPTRPSARSAAVPLETTASPSRQIHF
ncbi:hypothetical protein AAFF_G00092100 [Aldrovandia affinis]|uniref:Uncharacterized protein n=1 Tax=Aldrovandia affinis TaxID=143900 RepID=A0AAD7T2I0_9TELE|nr:hypothetical protein AAFF_G00092100 [Aldrovandia affinis]